MIQKFHAEIKELLKDAGATTDVEFAVPPKPELGDIAIPCFAIAKEQKKNPAEVAKELVEALEKEKSDIIESVAVQGPYVNVFLNANVVAEKTLAAIFDKEHAYGKNDIGKNKKLWIEYSQPNTHKAFHIGHLRGTISGESIARIFENGGYEVIRANYQGDVGMHIAKCLWGINDLKDEYEHAQHAPLRERIAFLGKAYAHGSKAFEDSEEVKEKVAEYNKSIYSKDPSVFEMYQETRQWSLEYFDTIYKRLNTHFDRFYFESEVFERAITIVKEFVDKGVFEESQGAIIFAGSKHGLHDRVFINSKGLPTYEGKDTAFAELQLKEYSPDLLIHITGKEQTEYFKVIFKALEQVLPQTIGKEKHLPYGWVSRKGEKMSSRKGNVILGEWLINEVRAEIANIMAGRELKNADEIIEKVAVGAVKYSFLKTGISNDIVFDMQETVSTSGDSGPYLQYIFARITSLLKKAGYKKAVNIVVPETLVAEEKQLLLALAKYPDATEKALRDVNPSEVAKYLFDLAQRFNAFYQACRVVDAEDDAKIFRLELVSAVAETMKHGLNLLGIETVDEM